MAIVKFNGGIGNQLFQYSFYKYCKDKEITIYADTTAYKKTKIHGGFLLNEVLPRNTLIEVAENVDQYYQNFNFFQRAYNKVFHHVGNHYYENYFKDWRDIIPFLQFKPDCYLEGWWQYLEIAMWARPDITREKCKIENCLKPSEMYFLDKIRSSESVSVHIRRGDYLLHNNLYGNICTEAYYDVAIRELMAQLNSATFFIFSDDEEFCRKKFVGERFIVIPSANSERAYIDMLLMSECKHHIVANSSFSWWGTMLAENYGIVIMPSKYNNLKQSNDLAIPGSILIDNTGKMTR